MAAYLELWWVRSPVSTLERCEVQGGSCEVRLDQGCGSERIEDRDCLQVAPAGLADIGPPELGLALTM
jgi:hypothetical protein